MPSIRNPKMPASLIVARRSARVISGRRGGGDGGWRAVVRHGASGEAEKEIAGGKCQRR